MADDDVVRRINQLADEEHRLHDLHEGGPVDESDRARLQEIELALDQCWDLLRQRRARREAGADPGAAEVRSESVVENYLQ